MIFGKTHYGKTDTQILKEIGWHNIKEMHEIKTIIFTHKILNCKEKFFYKDLLTQNCQRKTLAENKIGIMKNGYGLKLNEQNTFIFKTLKHQKSQTNM